METSFAKLKDLADRKWYIVDASNKILGRLATKIATILMGKHKPIYTPFLDTGDFVIVVNASEVKFSGKKLKQKVYQRFSGYPDGRREIPLSRMLKDKPTEVVRLAVKRMLPHTTLGGHMIKKLKVYADSNHPHQAQQPIQLKI